MLDLGGGELALQTAPPHHSRGKSSQQVQVSCQARDGLWGRIRIKECKKYVLQVRGLCMLSAGTDEDAPLGICQR